MARQTSYNVNSQRKLPDYAINGEAVSEVAVSSVGELD
jgi:hypothetical protein